MEGGMAGQGVGREDAGQDADGCWEVSLSVCVHSSPLGVMRMTAQAFLTRLPVPRPCLLSAHNLIRAPSATAGTGPSSVDPDSLGRTHCSSEQLAQVPGTHLTPDHE